MSRSTLALALLDQIARGDADAIEVLEDLLEEGLGVLPPTTEIYAVYRKTNARIMRVHDSFVHFDHTWDNGAFLRAVGRVENFGRNNQDVFFDRSWRFGDFARYAGSPENCGRIVALFPRTVVIDIDARFRLSPKRLDIADFVSDNWSKAFVRVGSEGVLCDTCAVKLGLPDFSSPNSQVFGWYSDGWESHPGSCISCGDTPDVEIEK